MSDDELDKLFKEAADGFQAPADPSAWKDMSSRLDQPVGTSVFWNWKTVSSLAVVGVTSVALIWFASRKESEQPITGKVPSTQPAESKPSQPSPINSADANTVSSSTDLISKESDPSISAKQKNKLAQRLENEVTSAESKSETVIRQQKFKESDQQDQNMAVKQEENSQPPPGKGSDQLASNQETSRTIAEVVPVSNDSLTEHLEADKIHSNSAVSDSAKEKPAEKIKKSGSALSVKLTIGSDFSSIKYFSPDKPGLNYGVLVGYSFNNRWSVYTGAISSRKIYSSTDIDKPYTTSGGYPYEVNELEGDCRVLDIPINFYYTFFPERSFSVKAGIGISSYLMFKENYTYHVDNPYGNDTYYQQVENENNEWFKMLNVSVILQKKLNNRFYFEFEPFLKAPLAGVGEGEVSLVSLGAFLNLRFDIPIKKQ